MEGEEVEQPGEPAGTAMEVEGGGTSAAARTEADDHAAEEEGEEEMGDDDEEEDEGEDDEDDDDEEGSEAGTRRGSTSSLSGLLAAQAAQTTIRGLDLHEDLTASALHALQSTEDKVVSLLETAAQTATELGRIEPSEGARERLRGHIDAFLSTTQYIHETLREQIKLIPPALPFEGHSYDAKMDAEIAKMEARAVRAQLGHIREYIEQQQQEFQRPS